MSQTQAAWARARVCACRCMQEARQAKRQWFCHVQSTSEGRRGLLHLGRVRRVLWMALCESSKDGKYIKPGLHLALGPIQQPNRRCVRLRPCIDTKPMCLHEYVCAPASAPGP